MSSTTEHLRGIAEADLQTIRDWLNSLDGCDFDELAADGGVTVGMVVQQQAREFAKRTQRALDDRSRDQARIAELEAALKEIAEHPGPNADDHAWMRVEIARALLKETPND